MRDRGYAEDLMARARAVGSPVLVLTIDLAVVGARHRDIRNGLRQDLPRGARLRRGLDLVSHPHWVRDVPLGGKPLTFGNLEKAVPGARSPSAFREWVDSQFDPRVTWEDIAWVREHWDGRLVVKGVLDPEDARRAADAGVDGIVVSNHGGRQLDSVPSTVRALPEVVDAVGDRVEVLVDGGVRTGLDVVKMLALGARAVLIGRAWALVGGGSRRSGRSPRARRDEGRHRRGPRADRLPLGDGAGPLRAGGRRRRRRAAARGRVALAAQAPGERSPGS